MAKLVSENYGEALFSLALEKGLIDSLMEEIQGVQSIFEKNQYKLLLVYLVEFHSEVIWSWTFVCQKLVKNLFLIEE